MKQKPIKLLQEKLKVLIKNRDATSVLQSIEIQYRIEVLLCMQMLLQSVPEDNTDMKAAAGHYRVLDAFIASLAGDRKYRLKYDAGKVKDQEAALKSFTAMLEGTRTRFKSFKKGDGYAEIVRMFIGQAYIVWYQYRQTFVEIKLEEKQNG